MMPNPLKHFPMGSPNKTGVELNAEKIPAHDRKEIIETNMIDQARPLATDKCMEHLCIIWVEYIEPGFDITCNACRERILKVFRRMKPVLIKMQYDSNLLNSI